MTGCSDRTEDANAKGALAQAQLAAGQLAQARATIGEAIAERDDIAELHLLQGRIELQANSRAAAFSAYSAALALDSVNMEALVGVAQLGLQLGHITESEDATNRALTLDPRQPDALLLKGLHNIIKRRYDDAVANADMLLAMSPNDENAAILKARALSQQGKADEAFAVVNGIRSAGNETLSVALTLLELYRLRGDGAEMVSTLERIRHLSPENVTHDIDEADTLYKLGATAPAQAILRRRLLDPKTDSEWATRIVGLWQEYDPNPLDEAALGAIAKSAGLPAQKAVARYYLDRGDPNRAAAALAEAPYIDDVAALRARAGVMQGKLDESLAQVERILAKDRTHCDALVAKAQIMLAKRRADDAVSASTQASSTCPDMPVAFLTLARAHDAAGNQAGAAIAFRDAFDRNDQDSALVRSYVTWLERHGQGTRAVSVARRLTNNAPSLLSAWRLYSEVCGRNPAENCAADAKAGLERARKLFGVDPRSDELPQTGLFGRLSRV